MAENGPGKEDFRWPRQCIKTVGGITSGWALANMPSLGARLVHALVNLLAATGGNPHAQPESQTPRGGPFSFLWGGGSFVAPWDRDEGSGEGSRRHLAGDKTALEARRLAELQEAAIQVGTSKIRCRVKEGKVFVVLILLKDCCKRAFNIFLAIKAEKKVEWMKCEGHERL